MSVAKKGTASFTEGMRLKADPVFEAIFDHPFVKGIADGDLSSEQLAHYVRQDYQYLTVFCQIYGLAISKCTSREDLAFFNEQIGFVLDDEGHPHRNLAGVSGYSMEELERETILAPTSLAYTRHMLHTAHTGTMGELLCALLPCPLTYREIGLRLKEKVEPDDSHPFGPWIEFYADPRIGDVCREFEGRVDRLAAAAGEDERGRMEENFLTSCRLEYLFWEMAHGLEGWPV